MDLRCLFGIHHRADVPIRVTHVRKSSNNPSLDDSYRVKIETFECRRCGIEIIVRTGEVNEILLAAPPAIDLSKEAFMTLDSSKGEHTGWLCEVAVGMCIGVSCRKLAFVTFTDPRSLRFSRKEDAEAFVSLYFKDITNPVKQITEHAWLASSTSADPE